MSAETSTTVETMEASTWQEKGLSLSNSHKRHQWEIADWLIEGIALYPDGTPHGNASKAYDVAEKLFPEYTRSTFQTWVCVARTFESLTRDKYPNLFFGHFKAVLGVGRPLHPPHPEDVASPAYKARQAEVARQTQSKRECWLAQAEEKQLSVSALRFAIDNSYEIENGKLAPQAQAGTELAAPPAKQTQAAKRKAEKSYSLPLSSQQRNALETLAFGRGISPAILAAHTVAEYLEAYADEVAGAAEQQAKQRAQIQAAEDAYWAIRDAERAAQEAARKEREVKLEEIWQEHVEPVRRYARENDNTHLLEQVAEFDEWRKQWLPSPAEMEARVETLLKRVEELKQAEELRQAQEAPQTEEPEMQEVDEAQRSEEMEQVEDFYVEEEQLMMN